MVATYLGRQNAKEAAIQEDGLSRVRLVLTLSSHLSTLNSPQAFSWIISNFAPLRIRSTKLVV
jgi:hypothetical protein